MSKFIFKFLTNYFLYGYLCLFGAAFFCAASFVFYKNLAFPKNLISVLFLLCAFPLLAQFLRIVFSTGHKFRYYKISVYRLKTRGYKDSYFECEMHEPCFRLIIKDLLESSGYKKEYALLKEKCRGKNLRVERAKEKLLARVKKEHEKNEI